MRGASSRSCAPAKQSRSANAIAQRQNDNAKGGTSRVIARAATQLPPQDAAATNSSRVASVRCRASASGIRSSWKKTDYPGRRAAAPQRGINSEHGFNYAPGSRRNRRVRFFFKQKTAYEIGL